MGGEKDRMWKGVGVKDLLLVVRTVFLVKVDESGFLVGLQCHP